MLEIPESVTIAKQLNETVRGKRIKEVETEHTSHSFAWYFAPGEKLPVRYQMRITLEDESSLVCTVQMYGSMFLIQPKAYDNPYYLAAKQKPFPFTEEFTYDYFTSLRKGVSGKSSMKEFLATHQRIPGLGNGVLQDILFHAGLHPKRKIHTLGEADWRRVYETVTGDLRQMLAAGGRSTEKDLFGNPGGYHAILSKKTVGKPCPYCGEIIQKSNYLGGTVYYCPQCQN